MNLRALARVAGLLGGACWVARMVLDRGGSEGAMVDALYWAGLALLFVALVGFGTTLVSKGAVWLQAIVGIAFPLLVWSVVEVLRPAGDPVVLDAVVGILIAGVSLLALGRSRGGDERPPRRHAGATPAEPPPDVGVQTPGMRETGPGLRQVDPTRRCEGEPSSRTGDHGPGDRPPGDDQPAHLPAGPARDR